MLMDELTGLTATVKYDEPLKNHTTFKIGGPVRAMCFPDDADSAVRLYETLREQGVTPYVMGNGSNILAADGELDFVVINTSRLKNMTLTDAVITADSGVLLSELAVFAAGHGLAGLEFAHGIPGTLGGAVVMNAGAYDGEMKDVVCATTAYSAERGLYTVTGGEHEFSYRKSVFMGCDDIILSSSLRLEKGDKSEIARKMEELGTRRRESQPLDKPSAGSVFKRPQGGFAAALIEQAGLKGFAIGGAQVSPKHAGFIVNNGDATFADVMGLIEHVQEVVEKDTGIRLELEVRVWK